MLFLLRYLLAASLFSPLEGITFGRWLALLRRERFRVHVLRWPRALWITATSPINSLMARRVESRFGPAIASARVEGPVFILGHYRSGTTHLHELMSLDPRYASPSRFQAYNPRTFLASERWLAPIVEPFMLPRRVQEDEIAFLNMDQDSPYMDWCFPRSRSGYARYLTFRDAGPAEADRWKADLAWFVKALTLGTGKPLILKSPPHTARVGLILEAFPDARFVHIARDPYAVFVSTMGLLKAVRPVFGLQSPPGPVDAGAVLRDYAAMYDAYFADRVKIPPGRLVEIHYADLDRDPIGTLRAIYDGLRLGDFGEVRPKVESYLGSIAGYEPRNRRPRLDDATRARVAEACARCFEAWGYPR